MSFEEEEEELLAKCMTPAQRRWELIKLCQRYNVRLYWKSRRRACWCCTEDTNE